MGLFVINRELKFGGCNHGKPQTSPYMAREEECSYREEEKFGKYTKKRVHGFPLSESFPGKKVFLLSVGLYYCPKT